METTIETDVIIVGAGTTGFSLAVQLIRYGISTSNRLCSYDLADRVSSAKIRGIS